MPANNGAVQKPVFQPSMRVVTAITNANPALVTTSFDNQFLNTDLVQFYMPLGFGMQQINGLIGQVTAVSPTTFTVNINTINFDVFSDPNNGQFAQVTPIAELNSTLQGATANVL
jgi:hypothetical protein